MYSWRSFEEIDCWRPHNPADIGLSLFLILGIIASYIPQHQKIIGDRSSRGISHWFLFLGSVSSFANMCNATILQFPLFSCCSIVPVDQCLGNLFAFIQLLIQWSMNFVIFILFYVYYPEDEKVMRAHQSSEDLEINTSSESVRFSPPVVEAPGWTWSKRVRILTLASMLIISIVCVMTERIFGFPSSVALDLSTFLGLLALVLSFFQFIPQIIKTYKLQQVGALSVTTMLMQAPGSFLICYTIAISPGTTVFTWITYFVGGCLQACLLILCLHLKHSQRHERIELTDD